MKVIFLSPDHCQQIKAEELKVQLGSGFGYSLSKELVDVDLNQFNDFAVGALFGESAIVLRSRPVISFSYEAHLVLPSEPIDPKKQGTGMEYGQS